MMRNYRDIFGLATIVMGISLTGCGGTQATDMSGYNTNSMGRSMDTTNVVSPATSLGAITLGAKLLPVLGKPAFITGVNVPSFSGQPDLELGKNPTQPTAEVTYNAKNVTTALQDISGIGCNVVRIVLFRKLDGLKLDNNGYVSGIDDTFLKNVSDLLSKAETAKLQVYLCLTTPWSMQTAAKNPLTEVAARTAFLKNAVTPLTGKLRGRPSVMAIDLIDGIETDIAGKDGNTTDKGATWDQARDYIKATVDVIKSVDPQRLVTCSSGMHGVLNLRAGRLSKLGLDFYDAHVYDDQANLPNAKDLRLDRPVLLGACGQKSTKPDNDLQAKSDISFLNAALQQGYAGALPGEYSKMAETPLNLLDIEGKHRPVTSQIQTFVSNLPMTSPSK